MGEQASGVSCAFCGCSGGPDPAAGRLVAGPKGTSICRDCLQAVTQLKNDGDRAAVRVDDPGSDRAS